MLWALTAEHLRPHGLVLAQTSAAMPAEHVAMVTWAIPPRLNRTMTSALSGGDVLCASTGAELRGALGKALLAGYWRLV